MTSDAPARTGLHPSLVLSAYIEPLLRGRRVAVFGDATVSLIEDLGKRGARLVHVYDPDHSRAGEAMARALPVRQHAITYAVLTADLGVRDGAFDLVIIPDLSIFPEPTEILRRARRLLAPAGAAVIVTPNLRAGGRRLLPEDPPPARSPAPPGYYELYDLVSLQFTKVRMVGQAPFVGYTIADFAPRGEPEVSVDTSFLPSSEEPEHFIAIAGDRSLSIDGYTVVALPWAEVGAAQGGRAETVHREDDRLALTETRTRLALMSAELEKVRDRQQTEARDAETRAATSAALSAKVVELELGIEEREARMRELLGRAGDNHVRAERLSHQIRDLEEELRHQRDRGTKLTKQLDDEKKARTKAELELGMIRGAAPGNAKDRERIEALTAELDAAQSRLTELEGEMVATQRRGQAAVLREASLAVVGRDEALEKLRRAEAKIERMVEIEADLAAAEAAKAAIAERLLSAEARQQEAERRVVELERRLAEATELIAQGKGLLAEAERVRAETKQRDASVAEHRATVEASIAEIAALVAERAELLAEVVALEAQLRERGHVVAALKRDLLESERIGKEILADLDAAGSNGVAAEGPRAAESREELRARLDALAESAARSEADLQAARWQISKLERDLAEGSLAPRDPTAVQIELEAALAAARDEVAALRRGGPPV